MSVIGSALPISPQTIRLPDDLAAGRAGSFGAVLDNMVSGVEQSQENAAAVTRSVLLGDNPNLHQSVIAMQEASLNFGLMVQVRNKVVESYQELMRLPV